MICFRRNKINRNEVQPTFGRRERPAVARNVPAFLYLRRLKPEKASYIPGLRLDPTLWISRSHLSALQALPCRPGECSILFKRNRPVFSSPNRQKPDSAVRGSAMKKSTSRTLRVAMILTKNSTFSSQLSRCAPEWKLSRGHSFRQRLALGFRQEC
jgi:hypothetical protein